MDASMAMFNTRQESVDKNFNVRASAKKFKAKRCLRNDHGNVFSYFAARRSTRWSNNF